MLEIITTYEQIDPAAWQALIDRSPYATWFQTPEAYAFYASVPEELSPFVIGVEREGELRALCIGFTTKEKSPLKQFFTRRAIIIGGPVISNSAIEKDVVALLAALKDPPKSPAQRSTGKADLQRSDLQAKPIYIETRNFHDYSRWKVVFQACGFEYQRHYDIHVHCDAAHSMSEQRQRQVKKATKNGVEVVQAQSEQEVRDWYRILLDLYATKVRTPLFAEEFFLQFYRQQKGIYLLVKHQGQVIGGMMCPILQGKALYEWYVCGMDEDYKELYPSVMATHAAIEYAKEQGLPLFDFMGAGKPDEAYGVRDFKMEFGGELVEHGRFLCVRKPLLYKIGKLGVKWLKR